MLFWKKQKLCTTIETNSLTIQAGELCYVRANGALTKIDIDALAKVYLRVLNGQTYWYLLDESGAFALLPESLPDIGKVRRYLSSWRGFDYDGLCRFDSQIEQERQLWPMPVLARVAA